MSPRLFISSSSDLQEDTSVRTCSSRRTGSHQDAHHHWGRTAVGCPTSVDCLVVTSPTPGTLLLLGIPGNTTGNRVTVGLFWSFDSVPASHRGFDPVIWMWGCCLPSQRRVVSCEPSRRWRQLIGPAAFRETGDLVRTFTSVTASHQELWAA